MKREENMKIKSKSETNKQRVECENVRSLESEYKDDSFLLRCEEFSAVDSNVLLC